MTIGIWGIQLRKGELVVHLGGVWWDVFVWFANMSCTVNLFLSALCRNTLSAHWANLPIDVMGDSGPESRLDVSVFYSIPHWGAVRRRREMRF